MKEELEAFSNFVGLDYEKFITILVSISIFALGILINQLLQSISAYNRRLTHRNLCKLNHKLLIEEIEQNASHLEATSRSLVIESNGRFDVQYGLFASLSVFKELGYENTYRAYLRGAENYVFVDRTRRIEAFNLLWKSIETINDTYPKTKTLFGETLERHNKINENRNVHIGKAMKLIDTFMVKYHGQIPLTEPLGHFYHQRQLIVADYRDIPNINPVQTNEYLCRILDLNNSHFDLIRKYENDLNSIELNTHIGESKIEFMNMKNNLDASRHYYSSLASTYKKTYQDLIAVYQELN